MNEPREEVQAVIATEPARGGVPSPGLLRTTGLLLAPIVLIFMLVLPAPPGLSPAGWRTAAVGLTMALLWMTEALPIPVTSLLPLILFPVLGIAGIRNAAHPYANPLIFLFMGGFMISMAMQKWRLHERIALNIIHFMGVRPVSVIAGFMAASAFLSMWVSNTATTMMMMPIGLSVIGLAATGGEAESRFRHNFATALMLGIAYASSIGGMATLIGTPTNLVLAGFLSETYGYELSFVKWLFIGVPIMLVGLPLAHFVLTRWIFPVDRLELKGGEEFIHAELKKLGPVSRGERAVAAAFSLTALLWITRPLLAKILPGISDAGIALFGAFLLFVYPIDYSRGIFALDWRQAEALPWGVLILFGGGLSLASAVQNTGLAAWIGGHLGGLSELPLLLIVLVTTVLIIFLTELTSNTATAATFLPIVASVAIGMHQNPLFMAVPAVLAASCAFMLPVATPPNAIVYGSGKISIPQMARAGIVLNILFTAILTLLGYLLVQWVLQVQPGVIPPWAVP